MKGPVHLPFQLRLQQFTPAEMEPRGFRKVLIDMWVGLRVFEAVEEGLDALRCYSTNLRGINR